MINSKEIIKLIEESYNRNYANDEIVEFLSIILKPFSEKVEMFELSMQFVDKTYKVENFRTIHPTDVIIYVDNNGIMVKDIHDNYSFFSFKMLDNFENWKSEEKNKMFKKLNTEMTSLNKKIANLNKIS